MILLTGVAGFIGMHLARRLLAEGHEVVGIDHLGPCAAPVSAPVGVAGLKERRLAGIGDAPGFRFRRLDLAEGGALEALFRAQRTVGLVSLVWGVWEMARMLPRLRWMPRWLLRWRVRWRQQIRQQIKGRADG